MKVFNLILILFISCMPNNKNYKMSESNISEIYNKTQNYDKKVIVFFNINYLSCSTEILVNDIPIYKNLNGKDKAGESFSFQINEYLLKSGKQELKIRIFPTSNEKDISNSSISNSSNLNLNIIYGDPKTQKIKDYQTAINYETNNSKINPHTPFIEIKKEFYIHELPYELKGWSESVSLTKEDKNKLQSEVVQFYNDFKDNYISKDIDQLSSKIYKRELEKSEANYFNKKEDTQKISNSLLKEINTVQTMLPIENYKMVFYGNGKVVALVRIDNEFRGESVIIGETEDNYNFYPIYLHRPTSRAPLEVIR
jgi:hypothetical protein